MRSFNCDMYWMLLNMYWEVLDLGWEGFVLGGFTNRGRGLAPAMAAWILAVWYVYITPYRRF